MRLTNKTNDTVEKVSWIIGHYLVFAAAVLISNARIAGRLQKILVSACVFMWIDFAVYLFELAMYFGLARTSI